MCTIISIDQSSGWVKTTGGLKELYLIPATELATITTDVTNLNEITAVTLDASKVLTRFIFDEEEANVEQTQEQTSRLNYNITQTLNARKLGYSSQDFRAMEALNGCCAGFYAFAVMNQKNASGAFVIHVLGMQIDDAANNAFSQTKKKLQPGSGGFNSGNVEGEAILTFSMSAMSEAYAPVFTGTRADLISLL
jgi:hypothetical protein